MKKYIYIYIGAEWCPKCKVYKPKFEEYCKKKELTYKIVDADDEEDFVTKHNIRNIPVVVTTTPDDESVVEVRNIEDFLKE